MSLRVLVCGGRNYDDRKAVGKALRAVQEDGGIACIIHGGALGADRLAQSWARHNGVPGIEVEAQWQHFGKRAGPLRNGWMLTLCKPDLVVAFPGGSGTQNMMAQAKEAGVVVHIPVPFGDGGA